MQISVALATYNGARYLDAQLDSIAGQSFLPAELVVSDDGSSDETLARVRAFAARAPFRVRVLSNRERLGFADNFLQAAESCLYPVIAFCDQDDIWLPDKLETSIRRLVTDDSILSMHRMFVVDQDLQPLGCWDQGIIGDCVIDELKLNPYITGWGNTMLFRRELVNLIPRAHRPVQPQERSRLLSHDTWIYTLAAALGRVSHINQPLILYRQHSGNAAGLNLRQGRLWHRVGDRLKIPIAMFEEQLNLYDTMTFLFGALAVDTAEPMSAKASAAMSRFAERRDLLKTRLTVYSGASICCRFRAFRELQRMSRDTPARLGGKMKELILGVAQLHFLSIGQRN